MYLFDTHFHYSSEEKSPEEYARMTAETMDSLKGVPCPERLYTMAVGGDFAGSIDAMEYAQAGPYTWFAAGVHPHEAENEKHDISEFRSLAENPRCRAVGELGLDYFYDTAPRKCQQRTLEAFLELALELNLPAILHCRDKDNVWGAYEDMYAIVRNFASAGGRMDIHCFAGTPRWAEKFLELGAFTGFTGIVTFGKAENIRKTLKMIPLENLLIETDSPYLAPAPYRGKPNNPGYLPLIAQRVALERGITIGEIAKVTTENAFRLFDLKGEQ